MAKPKKPSLRLRKLYKPLIDLCTSRIINAPPQTSGTGKGDRAITVEVVWPCKDGIVQIRPDGFPRGRLLERTPDTAKIVYNCVTVLKWFHERGYISYTASTLFAQRLPVMMQIAKLELGMERGVELGDLENKLDSVDKSLYNDCYDNEEGK